MLKLYKLRQRNTLVLNVESAPTQAFELKKGRSCDFPDGTCEAMPAPLEWTCCTCWQAIL